MPLKIKKEMAIMIDLIDLSKTSLLLIHIQKYKVEQCLGDSYL